MRPSAWVLLLVAVSAAAEPEDASTASAPPPTGTAAGFEQTAPPQGVPPASPAPDDGAMSKILQVRDELAKGTGESVPAAATPGPATEPSALYTALRGLSALIIVLGLILLLAWLLKRFGQRTPLLAGAGLAKVMGKVYLAPRVCLHFVRIGSKVLVIGVTQQAIAHIAEFDAESFEAESQTYREGTAHAPESGAEAFLSQLRATLRETGNSPTPLSADAADLAELRKDIQRLHQYLEDSSRAPKE